MARISVWFVMVAVLVGCSSDSSTETSETADTAGVTQVEVAGSTTVAEQPLGEAPPESGVDGELASEYDPWMGMMHDVALSPEGLVYGAAEVGIAYLDAELEWMILDVEGLPMGDGLEDGFPGRLIGEMEVGSDGFVWVAGSAHSTAEDEEFGGEVDAWMGGRYLEFVARGDCSGTDCDWMVYTSDDVPGLVGIGDLAVDAGGTVFAAGGSTPTMFVFDGTAWRSHVIEGLDDRVSPWSSSLAVTSDGTVWAGTNAPDSGRGLYAFDGTQFTHYTTEDGLPSDYTFQVSTGLDGEPLWVATDALYPDIPDEDDADAAAGIIRYDGTSWTVFTMADGLLTNDGFVAAGPDGTAWVLHSEVPPFGAAHYDGTAWVAEESPTRPGGFRSAADRDGSLWFASDLGLIHYDGAATTVYESPFIEAATTVETESSDIPGCDPAAIPAGIERGDDGLEPITVSEVTLQGGAFFTPGPLGRDIRSGCGFKVKPETITDGFFLPRDQQWDEGPVWWDSSDGQERWIELSLEGEHTIGSVVVQTDNNDVYLLSYRDSTSGDWVELWEIPYGCCFGMQTHPNPDDVSARYELPTPIATSALRLQAIEGDDMYSVSELQLFPPQEN